MSLYPSSGFQLHCSHKVFGRWFCKTTQVWKTHTGPLRIWDSTGLCRNTQAAWNLDCFKAALLFFNHTSNNVFLKQIKDLLHARFGSQTTAFLWSDEEAQCQSTASLCVCVWCASACMYFLSDFLVVACKWVSLAMGNMCSGPSAQLGKGTYPCSACYTHFDLRVIAERFGSRVSLLQYVAGVVTPKICFSMTTLPVVQYIVIRKQVGSQER